MKLRTRSNDTSSVHKETSNKYHDYPIRNNASGLYTGHSDNYFDSPIQDSKSRPHDMLEVDFHQNPTELYLSICATDWTNALAALEQNPMESKTWVVKRDPYNGSDDEEDNSVRFLPLHSACARQPPVDIIIGLLTIYPEASSVIDDNGMYPLHYACANQASAEVIGLLLLHFAPANMIRVEMGGSLPIHLSAQWGVSSPDVIELLLENNQSLACARDSEGLSPVEVAIHAEDYDYRQEVIEILQIHYEEEAMNDGDDSTISTHITKTNKKKRRSSMALLNQVVDVMRDEVATLSRQKEEKRASMQTQIELEWEAVNLNISEMKRKIEAIGDKGTANSEQDTQCPRKSCAIEQIGNDSALEPPSESIHASPKTAAGKDPGEVSAENVSHEYDIPGNLFDSKSFEGEDISYSLSSTDAPCASKNEQKYDKETEQRTPLDGAQEGKTSIIKSTSSKDSKGSISPWLRQWRKLAGRNSRLQDSPPDKSPLQAINESVEPEKPDDLQKNAAEDEHYEHESLVVMSQPTTTKVFSPKLSSMLVKTKEEIQLESTNDVRDLPTINQENELMKLEYAALVRRHDAYASKFETAEGALGELMQEIWKTMESGKDAVRKLQILKDDFKVTTAVRRAHLKSMLSDMDDDEIDIRHTDVVNSAGLLKNQRKALSFLEHFLDEVKS